MIHVSSPGGARNCAGISRRSLLRAGVLGAGGLTLADLLRAQAARAARGSGVEAGRPGRPAPATNRKSVILVWLDGGPTAAASIGQVHRGRWHDGREVAVKVQYPGAGEALRSDLRTIARLSRTVAPLVPGVDLKPLIAEMQARAVDELDYELEAEAQRAFAEARDAGIGMDADEQPVLPAGADGEGLDLGDLHALSPVAAATRSSIISP